MKEIYDVCSLTYSCENYMWKAYSNNSRGICLVFNVIDYDMLYPVEYVDKNKVDYTEMLIEGKYVIIRICQQLYFSDTLFS